MAESEEEVKSLLMKEEREKLAPLSFKLLFFASTTHLQKTTTATTKTVCLLQVLVAAHRIFDL